MKSDEKTDYIEKEFDRVLAIVRNDNINFEIEKLKSLVLSVALAQKPQEEKQPQSIELSKKELQNILFN